MNEPDPRMIELERVTVRFDGAVAVNEVTASVRRGEWVGLIGANGAGKTSLLRAVAQLEHSSGPIRVNGESISRLSRRRRAQLIAYVPQQPEFPADMSVLDYALLGRTPYLGYFGAETATDRRHCLLLLQRLGIDRLATRSLSTLSGGELQRAVLARALAQDAPVLLLDEPTSALDPAGRRTIHDLTLAAQFADRLLLLSDGAVVADGRPAEVLDERQLSACFGARIRVLLSDDGELLVLPQRYREPSKAATARPVRGAPIFRG